MEKIGLRTQASKAAFIDGAAMASSKNPSDSFEFSYHEGVASSSGPTPRGRVQGRSLLILMPVEIWPQIAAITTSLTNELRFQVRQCQTVAPSVGADGNRMAAVVVGAVDQ